MTTQRILITEVHNFGGFFGGDTVTFAATPWSGGVETTFTIDEKAFQNIDDRFLLAPSMLLDIQLAGERVDRAWVRAARTWDIIKPVIGAARGERRAAPTIRAYHCARCALWVLDAPAGDAEQLHCTICDAAIGDP